LGPPTSSARPSATAAAPRPASASKAVDAGTRTPRSSALAAIARAIGCSESVSTAAIRRTASSSVSPPTVAASTTRGLPSVTVPVLSKTTTSSSLWQEARLRALAAAHEPVDLPAVGD